MKKILGYLLIAIGIIFVVIFLIKNIDTKPDDDYANYTSVNEDGTKQNNSEEFHKQKKYKSLEISNIKYEYDGYFSTLSFDCKNTSNNDFEEENVIIALQDKEKNTLQTIVVTIPSIKSQESTNVSTSIDFDAINVYNFELLVD